MDKIDEALSRRVLKVLPDKEGLGKLLRSGKKIRLYQGFDPTGTKLHIGHSIGLTKLMDFANLGHEVIFLFGTGTVLVGDPSERDSARKLITQEEIDENIKNWKRQAEKIVDFDKVKIKQNGDWLLKLTLSDIVKIASQVSSVQLFKRESFQRRIKAGDTVWYHETMYPLLQGYDSVVMDVDLEIGGSDQEFNMLIGRELQKKMNNREKFVLTVPMILGTDGKQMSKTSGNCVWLDDKPEDMYAKIMSIPDSQIKDYFLLLTDVETEEIENLGSSPLANKKRLAFEITKRFSSPQEAQEAQEYFEKVVQGRQTPTGLEKVEVRARIWNLTDLLVETKLVKSKSEAKRLISEGAVEVNGKTAKEKEASIKGGEILKIGKHKFVKLTTNDG